MRFMHINFTTDTKFNKIINSLHELISVVYQQSTEQGPALVTCDLFSVHLALGSAVHRRKISPVDNAIGLPNSHPMDSDLSGG